MKGLPYGGAIVSRLEGSAKILKADSSTLVPLLSPRPAAEDGPTPRLPFGATVECVSSGRSRSPGQSTPPRHMSACCSVAGRSSDSAHCTSCSASNRMLDVLYVLAGVGRINDASGSSRELRAGDSLIAWHNTTTLVPMTAVDGEAPVVLKFHFPANILMLPPGTVVAPSPTHAQLQVLVDECQGDHGGQLSAQEAAAILSGVQQRAARAISHLYATPPSPTPTPSPAPAHEPQPKAQHHGPDATHIAAAAPGAVGASANNAVPVLPFLRSVLRSAAGGVGLPRPSFLTPRRQPSPSRPAASSSASTTPASSAEAHASAGPGPAAAAAASSSGYTARGPAPAPTGCVLLQRALEEFKAFQFPRQTNKLAFVFDPSELGLSLSFGVEVFEPGHHTPNHIHKTAHELFFVLAGEGVAYCNGQRFTVTAGDCVVFPPMAVHGIDNKSDAKLYCLQLMTPNEAFVEHVKSGTPVGRLDDEDLCNLSARHC
ncbi:hypothetical protein HYH03_006731 [Edaphochlamys debaryana]|uniref:Cupin type-2 domain-containing protein n=1 Tax=Edaphochlamys debaryana TaxID=47281 RepID=A0A835Y375_9CHLO|nr:hypothetical protein HYH03_006731 [Edaphochlamys debaryana]|eukprot:KAG2495121.1 hypothetical protein HYH03_006731 [Edaphochlamys debaryana]